jgi:nitroreductase/NAD-dependent dihydropyrimidine dehydrogenase PreA subunit
MERLCYYPKGNTSSPAEIESVLSCHIPGRGWLCGGFPWKERVIMITLDKEKCTQCALCITRFHGYCISEKDGFPVFDHSLCNLCQKCVAICPSGAIMVNHTPPEKITKREHVKPGDLYQFFRQRRTIKVFRDKKIPREILQKFIDIAQYAPNQNKTIDMTLIDDRNLINIIDKQAYSFFMRIYRFLFSFTPLELFIRLFYRDLLVVKKKMEHDLFINKGIVKKGTQVLIILTGNKLAPAVEGSAYCLLAAVMYYAESAGIGTCFMDALKIAINGSKKLKRRLHLHQPVLGVLVCGYPGEKIINIPRGYNINVRWNPGQEERNKPGYEK